ncbi:unnamed protein product [Staurois parvus]|uniref:Uncharacterized protein n=1 Tax=Staurois parvus TaxID=386267 RepID=A0ABN9H002_9NEOB|nr:unnamed protein product [Staurois parvus]
MIREDHWFDGGIMEERAVSFRDKEVIVSGIFVVWSGEKCIVFDIWVEDSPRVMKLQILKLSVNLSNGFRGRVQ